MDKSPGSTKTKSHIRSRLRCATTNRRHPSKARNQLAHRTHKGPPNRPRPHVGSEAQQPRG
eukprot:12729156-Ditylum_brightwellii.AAC.1